MALPKPPSAKTRLKRGDFNRICARPPVDRTRHYKLFAAASPTGQGRLGISVSGRIGKAVVRNRVRRRLKAALRERAGIPNKTDVVIVARSGIERLEYAALCGLLERSLRRVAGGGGRAVRDDHHATDQDPAGNPDPALPDSSGPPVSPVV
ncbi:MAG: ribonuclease P protein component [Nitrospinota bacterium]